MPTLPEINGYEPLDVLVVKFRGFFVKALDTPHDWEALRREKYADCLRPLVKYLAEDVRHELTVCALLALKWQFVAEEKDDERGIYETRGLACELVAWRFVTYLSNHEALDQLCKDLPDIVDATGDNNQQAADDEAMIQDQVESEEYFAAVAEDSPLLGPSLEDSFYEENLMPSRRSRDEPLLAGIFAGLNALEVAAVADAKKFLRQKPIQRIIDGIWTGDIVFWETLSAHSTKNVGVYRKNRTDPFCRLRVPLYLKVFELWFFAVFLAFYYTVLVQKHTEYITVPEIMLYVWVASFAYNELGEFWDAGSIFYAADFWSLWDLGIIATGVAFFIARMVGLAQNDTRATTAAFDILSVEALFLVPRLCSVLSLHPYFGVLIPGLKEMTKDFCKFLGIVVILYFGFATCFSFLARGQFSFQHMNWILIKVFFGSSYLGFDVSEQISPMLGPVLMIVFVALTNVLLITSMISLLSNTLTKAMQNSRDQYFYVYAVYVLEASTSNRLTYFLPPLNLVPLLLLRPLRLLAPAQALRTARITLLKATHWPFVALILGYEAGRVYWTRDEGGWHAASRQGTATWWGVGRSPRPRQASSPASLLRRPRSRLAATNLNLRLHSTEQARSPPASRTDGGVSSPAAIAHATAMSSMTTAAGIAPTPSLADMADVVASLSRQVEQLTREIAAMNGDPKATRGQRGRSRNDDEDREEHTEGGDGNSSNVDRAA